MHNTKMKKCSLLSMPVITKTVKLKGKLAFEKDAKILNLSPDCINFWQKSINQNIVQVTIIILKLPRIVTSRHLFQISRNANLKCTI